MPGAARQGFLLSTVHAKAWTVHFCAALARMSDEISREITRVSRAAIDSGGIGGIVFLQQLHPSVRTRHPWRIGERDELNNMELALGREKDPG